MCPQRKEPCCRQCHCKIICSPHHSHRVQSCLTYPEMGVGSWSSSFIVRKWCPGYSRDSLDHLTHVHARAQTHTHTYTNSLAGFSFLWLYIRHCHSRVIKTPGGFILGPSDVVAYLLIPTWQGRLALNAERNAPATLMQLEASIKDAFGTQRPQANCQKCCWLSSARLKCGGRVSSERGGPYLHLSVDS